MYEKIEGFRLFMNLLKKLILIIIITNINYQTMLNSMLRRSPTQQILNSFDNGDYSEAWNTLCRSEVDTKIRLTDIVNTKKNPFEVIPQGDLSCVKNIHDVKKAIFKQKPIKLIIDEFETPPPVLEYVLDKAPQLVLELKINCYFFPELNEEILSNYREKLINCLQIKVFYSNPWFNSVYRHYKSSKLSLAAFIEHFNTAKENFIHRLSKELQLLAIFKEKSAFHLMLNVADNDEKDKLKLLIALSELM